MMIVKKLSFNEKNAILLRKKQKEMYQEIQDMSMAIIEMNHKLKMDPKGYIQKDAVKFLMSDSKRYKNAMQYIKDVMIPLMPTEYFTTAIDERPRQIHMELEAEEE
jgi:hypothetical protein